MTLPARAVPIAAAVRNLAGSLGLHTVAEGVETADQAAHLRDLGYDAAQGFHFAHPMAADDLSALLDGTPLISAA